MCGILKCHMLTTGQPIDGATWQIRMLYDGDCPLCMKEVDFLRKRDEGVGNIDFVDISSPDYSPQDNAGIDFETAMGTIHAIRSDGSVISGKWWQRILTS